MNASQPIRFGKYWLMDRIAVGGMAELYRGKISGDEGFEKPVAVKKILPHLAVEQNTVNYFIDEARLAALLQHPNIAQIYDFGRLGDSYYIAMEYLFGKDLKTVMHAAKQRGICLSLENALYIAARISSGLDHAHNMKDLQGNPLNIIHRDVSPQNIIITYDGQVKIIDFGIAKAASRITSTRSGVIKGKVAYMSPEQAHGLAIDHRADIFAVGILLYEMVTARLMYQGDAMAILSLAREAQFVRPEQVVRDLPACVGMTLDKALSRETRSRYAACGDMLADLEDCIYHLDFRPSDQKLAQYMRTLFAEEFESEEASMTHALRQARPADVAPKTASPTRADYQETEVLAFERTDPRTKRGRRIGLGVLATLVLGMGWWSFSHLNTNHREGLVVVQIPSASRTPYAAGRDGSVTTKTTVGRAVNTREERSAPVGQTEKAPDARTTAELAAAERYLLAWHLTTPPGSNAYEVYRGILAREPDNVEAHQGIQKVGERYADLAAKEVANGHLDKAMAYIKSGLEVDASSRRLWGLREKIKVEKEQARQKEIQRLLVKANECIASLRLTKPPRDNALHYLGEVQKIDPGNAEVRRGRRKIADRYAFLAEKQMNRFQYQNARRHIDSGLKVAPRHEQLLTLRTEINKRLDQRVMRTLKNLFKSPDTQFP